MGDGSIGEEKNALEAWKKEAEENKRALEEIQKIAAFSDTLEGYQDFEADHAWDSFAASLEVEDNDVKEADRSGQEAQVFSIRRFVKIAAVLVVILGSFFVVNSFLHTPTSEEIFTAIEYSAEHEILEFDLSDGTEITLDQKSNLQQVGDRNVVLKGRAHFNVQRDEKNQFTIDLPVGQVVVLGTQFTIDATDKETEVYVTEGSVRYEWGQRTLILVAGDLVRVGDNGVSKVKNKDDNYDSWKNQTLIFRDSNMEEVVDALSKHFKKDIIIEDKKKFANCNVFNVFTNSSLTDILNDLSISHGLKYRLQDNKVYIDEAKC